MATPSFAVSESTQKILKNFSGISNHIILAEGQAQGTLGPSPSSSVLAYAELPEAWPKQTPIYDLGSFIGSLSAFEKPAIQFADNEMVITNNPRGSQLRIKYRYSDPSVIKMKDVKPLPVNDPSVEFRLTSHALTTLKKTAAMLKLSHFNVAVTTAAVVISGVDPKNASAHAFELVIPETEVTRHDAAFERTMRFQVGHVSLFLDGDYTVAFKDWKYAHLTSTTYPIHYYIAPDAAATAKK